MQRGEVKKTDPDGEMQNHTASNLGHMEELKENECNLQRDKQE